MREGYDSKSGGDVSTNMEGGDSTKKLKKKNRTLQYYKFLFYSMKTEIKVHDFVKMVRNSNMGEISIWILSLILYACTPKTFTKISSEKAEEQKTKGYKNIFIFFHILHVIRAFIGIFLIRTFPRSYHVIKSLESNSDDKLEKTLFNDLIRETIFFNVTEKIKTKKIPIIIYLILTIINFTFDVIDFLVILSSLSGAKNENKVILLTYLLMVLLYMIIDLAYVFWTVQLKYIFPKEYLRPIDSVFNGIVERAMFKFKLRKPKTDVVAEAKVQGSNQPYVKGSTDMKNGGINILENIFLDFGIYNVEKNDFGQQENEPARKERQEVREVYVDNNQNPPGSQDVMNENKLDE